MNQDIRFAIRTLVRAPAFSAIVVLTLALGIGANSAIFSVVNGVLLRPLAYSGSDRLVAVFEEPRNPTSPANFLDWKAQDHLFAEATAAHPWSPVLRGLDQPEQLHGLKASESLFQLLGAEAAIGRVFTDATADDGPVVVLGHELWQRRFGGDPELLGQSLSLDGEDHTVIGIMPPGFAFPPFWATEAELWVPLEFDPETAQLRGARFLRVFASLQPGIDLDRAQVEMTALADRLAADYPEDNDGLVIRVESLMEPVVGGVRNALWVLLGTVGFVLLIACANVANLFLTRASARRRELAVRSALGAGRGGLLRQLLTESTLLAVVAGGCGLLIAIWSVEALVAFGPENIPRLQELSLDGRVFGFTLLISLVTGCLFGAFPAASALRWNLSAELHEGGRQSSGRRSGRLRSFLVASEIALALMLLAGAGLMTKSLLQLWRLDPGFRTENVLALNLNLAGSRYEAAERQNPFFEELVAETRSLPGVVSAGLVNHLPIGGDIWGLPFQIDGRRSAKLSESPKGTNRTANAGFFETLGIPLLKGRLFDERDLEESEQVVIVSKTLAERYWPGQDAVGQRIQPGGPDSSAAWRTVVGVVGDVRQWQLADDLQPGLYFPYRQNMVSWFPQTTLVVHTEGGPRALREAVESRIRLLAPDVPIANVRTMAEILGRSVWQERFNASLLALFAGLAVVLAAVGIYGVMSYAVNRRRGEIGIRMALGAGRGHIRGLVVRQGLTITAVGLAVGLALAIALARFLETLLFGISVYDAATFAVVSLALALVALAACYFPARRASRLDPLVSLRSE